MAVGSGVGSSVGVAEESSYGTGTVPTKWVEVDSESLIEAPTFVHNSGLAGGVLVDRLSQRQRVQDDLAGDLKMTARCKNQGLLWKHALGAASGPTQFGATPAYTTQFTLADIAGLSLSAQKLIADTGGTLHPFTGTGLKIRQTQLECGAAEQLKATFGCNGRLLVETVGAGSPSYVSGNTPLNFRGSLLSLGTLGAEIPIGVKKLTVTLDRPLYDQQYSGGFGRKSGAIMNGRAGITGTLDADLTGANYNQLLENYRADVAVSLIQTFTGPAIATATVSGTLLALVNSGATNVTLSAYVPPGSLITVDTGGSAEQLYVVHCPFTGPFIAQVISASGSIAGFAAGHANGVAFTAQVNYALQLRIPGVVLSGTTPVLAGLGVVPLSVPIEGFYDDVNNPFQVLTVGTDTTL